MNSNPTVVQRRIDVSILKDPASAEQAVQVLAAVSNTLEVKLNPSGKKLRVRYDLKNLNYSDLIRTLSEQDLVIPLGRWQRFKVSWYRDQDINIRDNVMAIPAPCCSNPTGITGSSRKRKRNVKTRTAN